VITDPHAVRCFAHVILLLGVLLLLTLVRYAARLFREHLLKEIERRWAPRPADRVEIQSQVGDTPVHAVHPRDLQVYTHMCNTVRSMLILHSVSSVMMIYTAVLIALSLALSFLLYYVM